MRTSTLWTQKVSVGEYGDNCVYDACFSPDGSQLIAAVGMRILVINVADGSVVQTLKGHKSTVYCVAYSYDGKRFASGGADKNVIIWADNLQGSLKYVHGESIQCLAYNPQSQQLASCAVNDFGLWAPEKKSVDKHKIPAKINCCAWTPDGLHLAIGLGNGMISIRNKSGSEYARFERPGGVLSPVWGLAWGRMSDDANVDMLCVADWGQTLSFYDVHGKPVMKERSLGFDPVRVVYAHTHRDCEFIIVAGSNKACTIFTQEGVKVTSIAEHESWVWACAVKPDSQCLAVGTQEGVLTYYEVQLLVVHALYKSLYAFRMNMTDVMVQNLLKDLRVRIKCRDVIKKLAIFKDSLAIQFVDRVLIYQRDQKSTEFKYTLKDKISQSFECSLLVMCSENVILCQEKKLQCYSFNGVRQREWVLNSHIRYIRSVGGMKGKEVLLAGLKNGQVVKIFLDNPFPIDVVKVPQSVRCVDLNLLHSKIAVVDESSTLFVYDLVTKELLFQEPSAVSVFWNAYCDDLLSFSGFGVLNIKASNFPIYQQKMAGFVVGFCGHKLFSMQNSSVVTLEVPLSAPMFQYIQNKMFKEAYTVASLGVPLNDWKSLGLSALEGLDFDTARKAFGKTKSLNFLRLIETYEDKVNEESGKRGFLAEVYAHQGRFTEAARLFRENNEAQKAVAMYADLRMFDLAQDYLSDGESANKSQLLKRKAEWAEKINEPRAAAEMYWAGGEKIRALQIMGENQWIDMLLETGRKLDRSDDEALTLCGQYLMTAGEGTAAADMYRRVGAVEKVLDLYVYAKNWPEVFHLVKRHPSLTKAAYLPYAQWLAENDRFSECQKAFHTAGCPEEAFSVLEQLIKNAVFETRYHDAGYCHWVLSMQFLDLAATTEDKRLQRMQMDAFHIHQKKAAMYYAFNSIYRYTDQPFTPFMPDALFNIAKFLMHELMTETDLPISKFHVLYTLAKQARTLKAYKLARHVLERLKRINIPRNLRDGLKSLILSSYGDKFSDNEDLLPMCYRCSTTNPLLNPRGNHCITCNHPFMFSFVSYEMLPVVEFEIEGDISDEEALGLIGSRPSQSPKPQRKSSSKPGGRWKEEQEDNVQVLHLDDEEDFNSLTDPFSSKSGHVGGATGDKPNSNAVILGRTQLRSLDPTEVIVCKWPLPLRYKFYKNLMQDIMSVSTCHKCFKMFHTDDFVLQVLQKSHCPFCRSPPASSEKNLQD